MGVSRNTQSMDKTTRLLRRATRQLIRRTFRECGVECCSVHRSILAIVYAQAPTSCERYTGMLEVEHRIDQGTIKVYIHSSCLVPATMKDKWRAAGYHEPWVYTELELADPDCFPVLATLINAAIPVRNRTRPHYKHLKDRSHLKNLMHRQFMPDDTTESAAKHNAVVAKKPRWSQKLATLLVHWLIYRFDLRLFEKNEIQTLPKAFYLTHAIRRFCKISTTDVDLIYKLAEDIKATEVNRVSTIETNTQDVIKHG